MSEMISPAVLLINEENPRILQPNEGQHKAIQALAQLQGRKLLAMAIVAGALALAAACAHEEVLLVETPPSGVTPNPPTYEAAPTYQAVPQPPTHLTAQQEAQVEDIIARDPTIREVLGGRTYSVGDFATWHSSRQPDTGDFLLIGAGANITLSEPIPRVEHDWPVQAYRPYWDLWPPEIQAQYQRYRDTTERFTVHNLTEMYVFVDLGREKLVEIMVSDIPDGQQVTHSLVWTPEPGDGGESLARQVFEADERVQAILADREYEIPFIWTAAFEDARLGMIIVQFHERYDIEADWPLLIDLDQETGVYEVEAIHFTAEAVSQMHVLINLDEQQVVGIKPEPGD